MLFIIIEDNVWCGEYITVLKGVHIRVGTIIGAGLIINRDITAFTTAAGTPVKIIKTLMKLVL